MTKRVREFFAKSGDYIKEFSVSSNFKKPAEVQILKKTGSVDTELFEKVLTKFNSRRSCRSFSSKPVSDKIIFDIIKTSLKGPCAGNIENVYVVIIDDKQKMHNLARIHGEQTWAGEAPLMLAVIRDDSRFNELYSHDAHDLSIQNSSVVITSILYLLQVAGYGACWVKTGDNSLTCAEIGCSDSMFVDALIPVGFSIDVPESREYVEITERVSFNKFGNKDRKPHH